MNLLVDSDLIKESHIAVFFLINGVSPQFFHRFIKAIDKKGDWNDQLCSCYFETIDNVEYYRFETFEDEISRVTYNEFIHYLKLAIIRYLFAWGGEEDINKLKEILKNTSFAFILDEVDESYLTEIPLVY